MSGKYTYVAGDEDRNKRIDVFISEKNEDITRSRVKNLIEERKIFLNGKAVVKSGLTVKEGDNIDLEIPEPKELDLSPSNIPIEIVYEDDSIAVINKKQGMVVHPAPGAEKDTLVNALLHSLSSLSSINGVIRPGIVHRLDKDTSGLIVIAKTDEAHVDLQKQIAAKDAKRYYIALVDGRVKNNEGVVDIPIERSKKDRKKMAVSPTGRNAVTLWKVIERYDKPYTLMEYELKTGRTHQIRVHSKHIGHPIVGDPVYGGSNAFGVSGQLLHAYKLVLAHPVSNEIMVFKAELPKYFTDVLEKIR